MRNYLLSKTVKACGKCAPLRGHGMTLAMGWERCGPPAEVVGLGGPEICLSGPVIDRLLVSSLKAQEAAGIILEHMWHRFFQI